jgi:Na+-transporting NADH:ubiquinone oxidoreductase subunit F
MEVFFSPLILIAVLIAITLLIIFVDVVLGNSGPKAVVINNQKTIDFTGDDTLLNVLAQNKIFIPSACGGKATCGLCKCKVTEGGGDVRPTELPMLSANDKANGVRLSCQVKPQGTIKIEIPASMLTAQEFSAKLVKMEQLTYDIKLLRFKLINPKTMPFKPGQYAQIKVPGIDVVRAYSIASDPVDPSHIEFIVRYVPKGVVSSYVFQALQTGDKLILTGPYGNFYLQEKSTKDIVCIAGGSGKAPIRSILARLKALGMPRKVRYFFGAKAVRDLYYDAEFAQLQKEYPNFEYIPALSNPLPTDNWQGATGLITDVLDRMTGGLENSEAYLCGSPGMIDACIKVLNKHQIKSENVFFDKFS